MFGTIRFLKRAHQRDLFANFFLKLSFKLCIIYYLPKKGYHFSNIKRHKMNYYKKESINPEC